VIAASRGGKAKTVVQSLAIGLYILPLSGWMATGRWWVMAVAVVLTVLTGLDYVYRALTLLPWRMGPDDAAGLRAEGWDDAAILQVIAVVAGQNADSRLRFGLIAADRELSATAARSG
jgi:hypothetical protein